MSSVSIVFESSARSFFSVFRRISESITVFSLPSHNFTYSLSFTNPILQKPFHNQSYTKEILVLVDDPASLDPLFLKRDYRKVKHDGTISIEAKLYEVPPKFIGHRVEVRYDETGVYIYEDGILLEKAVPVNFSDNAHVKRERSLSFRAMSSGKEG